MQNPNPSEGPSPGAVVSAETLMEWRRLTAKARERAANLNLVVEFEAEFRLQKKRHAIPEAARRALEQICLPKLLKEEIAR
jgi:hypothetical protein